MSDRISKVATQNAPTRHGHVVDHVDLRHAAQQLLALLLRHAAGDDDGEEESHFQVVEISPRHGYNTRKSLMRRLTMPRMTSLI